MFDELPIMSRTPVGWIRFPREQLPATCMNPVISEDVSPTIAPGRNVVEVVPQLLAAFYNRTHPSIAVMAENLEISRRSLQRRLTEAHTSYSQVVQTARYNEAARLLDESDMRVIDVAYNLGYDDASHFARFFQRISSVTPREYRRLHEEEAPCVMSAA